MVRGKSCIVLSMVRRRLPLAAPGSTLRRKNILNPSRAGQGIGVTLFGDGSGASTK
jgi:hypothetical protein